jgi:hypothetical protein
VKKKKRNKKLPLKGQGSGKKETPTYVHRQKGQHLQKGLTERRGGNRIRNGHPYCKRKARSGISLCLDGSTEPNTRLQFQSDPIPPRNCGM